LSDALRCISSRMSILNLRAYSADSLSDKLSRRWVQKRVQVLGRGPLQPVRHIREQSRKKGNVTKAPYREHVPPDVTACIFWLKNRNPAQWRDAWQLEATLGKYVIADLEWMKEAYRLTRKDGAPGIDGVTADEYATNLEVGR
jgi:hypothetical protein